MTLVEMLRARFAPQDAEPVILSEVAETMYALALLKVAKEARDIVARLVTTQLETIASSSAWSEMLEVVMNRATTTMGVTIHPLPIAAEWSSAAVDVADRRWMETVRRAFGVDIDAFMNPGEISSIRNAYVNSNVKLIRSIPAKHLESVEQIITNGVARMQGNAAVAKKTAINQMAREIQAVYGVTKKRAKLIATDQTIKLTSAIEEKRQRDAGVTRYTWRTMNDSRVRPAHKVKEGKVYQWSSSGEKPGQAINCRCHAQPKF